MKKICLGLFLALTLLAAKLHADDGGFYSVVPYGAKYDKQARTFTFTGQYAQEFKKLLPPAFSVLTNMDPSLTNGYNKNFRGLMLKDAAGNAVSINCESATVEFANNKQSIKEKPETTCTVQVMDQSWARETPTQKLQVKDALDRAQQANQLK